MGPTASGKTELALKLAKEQNAELISVDSRQAYKHLRVGTAKPEGTWTNNVYLVDGIPYHLLDFLDPSKSFSAADFVQLALEKVSEIQKRGKTPIFVGGTGLYFKALTEGLANMPPANDDLRAKLQAEAEQNGRAALHARLATIDPEAAAKIPANNIQRVVRALEVFEVSGKPISQWHAEHEKSGLKLHSIGINLSREELVHRIEARCRTMMDQGMIEETQVLLSKGYSETSPALTGLGYPRIIAMLKGTITKPECLNLLIQDTRQYAKRQTTWFRHQMVVEWKK